MIDQSLSSYMLTDLGDIGKQFYAIPLGKEVTGLQLGHDDEAKHRSKQALTLLQTCANWL